MARTLSLLQRRAEDAAIALLYLNDEAFDAEGESTLRRAWYWNDDEGRYAAYGVYLTDGHENFAFIERKDEVWRATLLAEREA